MERRERGSPETGSARREARERRPQRTAKEGARGGTMGSSALKTLPYHLATPHCLLRVCHGKTRTRVAGDGLRPAGGSRAQASTHGEGGGSRGNHGFLRAEDVALPLGYAPLPSSSVPWKDANAGRRRRAPPGGRLASAGLNARRRRGLAGEPWVPPR